MSYTLNTTGNLWQRFMPRHREIANRAGSAFYSVEVYDDLSYFERFNPDAQFTKWAGVEVTQLPRLPEGMEILEIPAGLYAVFNYKGASGDVPEAYQYIYGTWIPQSGYDLDDRPHFAVMGEKYRLNDPASEEEIWIPIREKM